MTKERDETLQFKNKVKLTKLNIHKILKTFDIKEFEKVLKVVKKGFINVSNIKEEESETS
jgi:hypothetical protein